MIKRSGLNLFIITLPIIIFASLFIAGSKPAFAGQDCVATRDLDKSISQNVATVKNNSNDNCSYTVTLALYDSPFAPETNGWIEAQTLIGSVTRVINPGQTADFSVEDKGESCYRQADLFEGSNVLQTPIYTHNLATAVYGVAGRSCEEPTATPTQQPTSTPTPGPTDTPTPGPTSTPEPGPTSTPVPGQSGSTQATVEGTVSSALASTGNTAFIYSVVIAGAVFLISGLILRKFGK